MPMEDIAIPSHEQRFQCILNLQNITEKLLFSMNLPNNIAEKYNFLKWQTFENLGLSFQPGVVTYQPSHQPSTQAYNSGNTEHTAAYSSTNYVSTGGLKQTSEHQSAGGQHMFSQIEEIMKSCNEHLSNMTKGIVLEEDNSFIQESLSKKFLEPLKDTHFNQFPKDFLKRVDSIKFEFDSQIRKLIDHFYQQKEEVNIQNERKIELLKQESSKYRMEVQNIKAQHERQCKCKVYEETLEKVKEDNHRYVEQIKQKYEDEIYDIKQRNSSLNFDGFREKIFTDILTRVLSFVQEKHNSYLNSYCQDQGIKETRHIDPLDLLFYVCERLHCDNNWLVDTLAEVQEELRRLQDRSQVIEAEQELLSSQLFTEIMEQTEISQKVLENFAEARDQLKNGVNESQNESLKASGKENIPFKRQNYTSGGSSMRESLQSTKSFNHMSKSLSGRNLNHKYQQLMNKENEVYKSYNNCKDHGAQNQNKLQEHSHSAQNDYN